MHRLPLPQREIARALVDDLARIPGLVSIVLGGSHARGRATPTSDVDLGLGEDTGRGGGLSRRRAGPGEQGERHGPKAGDVLLLTVP